MSRRHLANHRPDVGWLRDQVTAVTTLSRVEHVPRDNEQWIHWIHSSQVRRCTDTRQEVGRAILVHRVISLDEVLYAPRHLSVDRLDVLGYRRHPSVPLNAERSVVELDEDQLIAGLLDDPEQLDDAPTPRRLLLF